MSFKPEEYLHYFEGYDLTEEEKIEFIETLWLIAQSFADQGLGIGSAANDNSTKARTAAPDLANARSVEKISTDAANDNDESDTKNTAA